MFAERRQTVSLYVHRTRGQWIVHDLQGDWWVLPLVQEAWEQRERYYPDDEDQLEPVPGHYKPMLGLPF